MFPNAYWFLFKVLNMSFIICSGIWAYNKIHAIVLQFENILFPFLWNLPLLPFIAISLRLMTAFLWSHLQFLQDAHL